MLCCTGVLPSLYVINSFYALNTILNLATNKKPLIEKKPFIYLSMLCCEVEIQSSTHESFPLDREFKLVESTVGLLALIQGKS